MAVEYDFDVIVVGGGVAGLVTSYLLAKEGHEVLLAERGIEPGSKNLSGGIFYCQVMEEIFPGFAHEAPVERVITRNTLSFLNDSSAVNVDYWDERLATPVNAVSVLRAKLDPWLAEQAEEAGVTIMPGVRVDSLVREGDQFVGIQAGEDTLYAKVVVAADGINSFLAQYAGVREKTPAKHLALGVKSVIELGEDRIRERFHLTGGEGAAYAIVGDATLGIPGGAFLYTNKSSVSIGVVVNMADLVDSGYSAVEIHDHLINHPYIAPFLEDGELLEYGSHAVAEGGEAMQTGLVHDGLVIIGDAAGYTINNGFTIRGMDLAAGSAQAAAKAIDAALRAEDYSAQSLDGYRRNSAASWLGKDMKTFNKAPEFLATTPEMYGPLGEILANTLFDIYNVNLTPRKKTLAAAWGAVKKSQVSMGRLATIALKIARFI